MFYKFTTVIFIMYLTVAMAKANLHAELINDLVRNERIPTILHLKVCWARSELVQFLQMQTHQIEFLGEARQLNIRIDELTNTIWFVLDMKCLDGVRFLQEVSVSTIRKDACCSQI